MDDGPQWVVYLFIASALFWTLLAIKFLFTAFTSPEK
jgi:hypothetical protein